MIRKLMLSLGAAALTLSVHAQKGSPCASDEFHKQQIALHPQILLEDARLKADIDRYVYKEIIRRGPGAKSALDSTGYNPDTTWLGDVAQYHVPMVVHIIYDGPASTSTRLTDNDIYGMVSRLNTYYSATDAALSGIINPFKPYIGNAHIMFHLANKDPQGKPTRGIVRQYSYLSNYGDESAKIDQWPPDQYLNLYLINVIGRGATGGIVLAYATFPGDYSSNPYSQGVISRADQATSTGGDRYTVGHEIGHFLSLYHVWNSNGKGAEEIPPYVPGAIPLCGDDEVDDTPPTIGHFYTGCAKINDTFCATGYYKDYDTVTFYHMTGMKLKLAAVESANTSVLFNDTLNSIIGQSFTTGVPSVTLQSISVRVGTGQNNGGSVFMNLYNGSTLVGTSVNTQPIHADSILTFNFTGYRLDGSTTYRFVIASIGKRSFPLAVSNDTDRYLGGSMFNGATGSTPVSGADLYFAVRQYPRIDYPDTTNTQNIMDYSSCTSEMFTRGQVARMRATLRSDVGNRYKLIGDANLIRTGITDASGNFLAPQDITPTALFTVNRNFTCAGSGPITFTNRSYNDTIANANWTFNKGADISTSTSINSEGPTFSDTGWVTATLTVAGNNTGSDTYTRNDLVYVADPNGMAPYIEEFNPSNQLGKFPIFNYYGNPNYKWELYNSTGFYDKTCIRFRNYDVREEGSVLSGTALNTAVQSPRGLYADFFTPAYNIAGDEFSQKAFLSFFSAGAYRTTKPIAMNDTLLISYSTDCGQSWSVLKRVTRSELANNGYRDESFVPGGFNDWREQSIAIPTNARTAATYFRFRYYAGTDNAYLRYGGLDFGTGNNFYLDRLNVTPNPLGLEHGVIVKLGMTVLPNPTNGSATISLNGGDNSTADVNVTDITGKLVYHTSTIRSANTTEITRPANAIRVQGLYMVQVVTNGATETQKLIVY